VPQPILFKLQRALGGARGGGVGPLRGRVFVFASTFQLSMSDSVTLSDVAVKLAVIAKADTATLSDAAVKRVTLSKTDTATLSDAVAKAATLAKTDTATISDATAKATTIAKTDTATLSDAVAKTMRLAETDTASSSDSTTATDTPTGFPLAPQGGGFITPVRRSSLGVDELSRTNKKLLTRKRHQQDESLVLLAFLACAA